MIRMSLYPCRQEQATKMQFLSYLCSFSDTPMIRYLLDALATDLKLNRSLALSLAGL